MTIKNRYVGTCVQFSANRQEMRLDTNEFINSLLLFEHFTLHSVRLLELPPLIRMFGFEDVLSALRAKAIQIKCDANIVMSIGGAKEGIQTDKNYLFRIFLIRASDHGKYVNGCLESVHKEVDLQQRQFLNLKKAVQANLDWEAGQIFSSDGPELKIIREFFSELPNNVPPLKQIISSELKKNHNFELLPAAFELTVEVERSDSTEIKVETNLTDRVGLDKEAVHKILENALLDLAETYERIVLMRRYESLTGVRDQSLRIIDDKWDFLVREHYLHLEIQNRQLKRVLEIKGLPDFSELSQHGGLSLAKLLDIRERKECIEFRNWLSKLDTATDNEIKEQVESYRIAFGNFLGGGTGKVIKFIASNAIGSLPIAGTVAGLATSFIDDFILEKICPTSGPVIFINNLLPSAVDLAQFNQCKPLITPSLNDLEIIRDKY